MSRVVVRALDRVADASLFMCGLRPMFFAATLYAAFALAWWTGFLAFGLPLPAVPGGPAVWHAHESMFGFAMAGVAGFALTAIPEFTKTAPFGPRVALMFASLWLAGRLGFLVSGAIGALPAALANIGFPTLLVAVLAPRLLADPDRRHSGFLWAIAALALTVAGFYVDVFGGRYPMRWLHAAIGAMMSLIIVAMSRVSMRIVNDALDATRRSGTDVVVEYVARRPRRNLAIIAIIAHTVSELHAPQAATTGWLGLATAAALFDIQNDWHVGRALFTRWAAMLYSVYWLMALGYAALGAAVLVTGVPPGSGRHLLTAGAMGMSVFTVMCIAGRVHAGYPLDTRRWVSIAASLIGVAAVLRALSPLAGDTALGLLVASGTCWVAAFGLAGVRLGSPWLSPRIDGRRGCEEARTEVAR